MTLSIVLGLPSWEFRFTHVKYRSSLSTSDDSPASQLCPKENVLKTVSDLARNKIDQSRFESFFAHQPGINPNDMQKIIDQRYFPSLTSSQKYVWITQRSESQHRFNLFG